VLNKSYEEFGALAALPCDTHKGVILGFIVAS
jgi:hypothetical protein